ncbi:hypothetical protein HYU23_04400 [Candidatus Woesearchaeota archaeon]|nr:hypothetical protein [Candidatus Woesearchaeota archaeon]
MADKDEKPEGRIDTAIIPAALVGLANRPTGVRKEIHLGEAQTRIFDGIGGSPLGERETHIFNEREVGALPTLSIAPVSGSLAEAFSDDAGRASGNSGDDSVFELPKVEEHCREPKDTTKTGLGFGSDAAGGTDSPRDQRRDTLVDGIPVELKKEGLETAWFKIGDQGLEENLGYGLDENAAHRRRVIGAFSVLGLLTAIGLGYILTSNKPAVKTYDFRQIERKGMAVFTYNVRKGDTPDDVVNAFNYKYNRECSVSIRKYHLFDNAGKALYRAIPDVKTREISGLEDIGAGEYFRTGGTLQIRFGYSRKSPSPCVDPPTRQKKNKKR